MRSFFIVAGIGLGVAALAVVLLKLSESEAKAAGITPTTEPVVEADATLGTITITDPNTGIISRYDGETGKLISRAMPAPEGTGLDTFEISEDTLLAAGATAGSA